MENQILETAARLFLELGYKTVTMDSIATEMGISKKTIYQYYNSKPDLVEKSSKYVNYKVLNQIKEVVDKETGAIEQLITTHINIHKMFCINTSNVFTELIRYYPEIAEKQKEFHEKEYVRMLENNLRLGINQGVYRSSINIAFVSRYFVAAFTSIDNPMFFTNTLFTNTEKKTLLLEQYFRSIVTPEGLTIFLQQLDEKL